MGNLTHWNTPPRRRLVVNQILAVGWRHLLATQVPGQGRILAFAAGTEVVILLAKEAGDLAQVTPAMIAPLGAAVETAVSAPVSAWLDVWDRHDFKFYYRLWESPRDQPWKDYDVLCEFDFAKREDASLVLWATPSEMDIQAGGSNNRGWWEFPRAAQVRHGEPWALNTSNVLPSWRFNRHPGERLGRGACARDRRLPRLERARCNELPIIISDAITTAWLGCGADNRLELFAPGGAALASSVELRVR